jgi:hypothetical protein
VFSLEKDLELRRISLVNYARLLDCLERIINKEISHIYDWPQACESYLLDICSTESAQYAAWCRNFLQAPARVRRICAEYFSKCLSEAYG